MPSLHDIEKSVFTLWQNKQARDWLIAGRKDNMPDCLKDAPAEVLDTVDQKGINLYGQLARFGHQDVMESIYPYCAVLLGKKWAAIVDDYLLHFPPSHHNFNRLCQHLPQYFKSYGGKTTERYPFLAELADYEWIELEKMEADCDIVPGTHTPLTSPQQVAQLAPLVNPTLTIRDYQYNILEIASYLQEKRKLPRVTTEPTLVAVFRHPESHRCKYVEIGETAAKVVQSAVAGRITYQAMIPDVVALTPDLPPQETVAQFLELIEDLQELGIFIGSTVEN